MLETTFERNTGAEVHVEEGELHVSADEREESFKLESIENLSVVEDYTVIEFADLIIQSFFALCFALLLGSFSLLLFVGVDLGQPNAVIASLLERNFFLTAFLFAGGIISPSVLFLTYYRYVRSHLIQKYEPDTNIIEFDYEETHRKLTGVPEEQAESVIEALRDQSGGEGTGDT